MTEITIRPARADEAADVAAVHVQADEETYAPIFGEAFVRREFGDCLRRWLDALAANDVFLVAAEGERIVGFAHAHDDWMSAIYLLASHHRRGVGAKLLARLCDEVRARGVAEIGFQAVADNVQAIAFYEARGARQIGRKTVTEGDESWEEVEFRLPTASPAASREP